MATVLKTNPVDHHKDLIDERDPDSNSYARFVRNWWIEVEIDERVTQFKAGPKTKDGGFELTIYQRDDSDPTKGDSIEALHVVGLVGKDGKLRLEAKGPYGEHLADVISQRDG